jgi:retron-type reverse transcriptase
MAGGHPHRHAGEDRHSRLFARHGADPGGASPGAWGANPQVGWRDAQLGIPTVADRLVQQAITQVLEPRLALTFSGSSYGFRPGRGTHDALRQARGCVADGYEIVVDLDQQKFFGRCLN